MPILMGLSIVSNKLYLFTFVFPLSIIILIFYQSRYNLSFKSTFNLHIKDVFDIIFFKKLFFLVSIPLLIAVNSIILILNSQPMPNVNLKLFRTIEGLANIANRSYLFVFISIIYIVKIIFAFYAIKKNHSSLPEM